MPTTSAGCAIAPSGKQVARADGIVLRLGGLVRRPSAPRPSPLIELWRSASALVYRSPLYRLLLSRAAASEVAPAARDPWPGDAARGNAILHGTFGFHGQQFEGTGDRLWTPPGAHAAWRAELHGFGWLRDLPRSAATVRAPGRASCSATG